MYTTARRTETTSTRTVDLNRILTCSISTTHKIVVRTIHKNPQLTMNPHPAMIESFAFVDPKLVHANLPLWNLQIKQLTNLNVSTVTDVTAYASSAPPATKSTIRHTVSVKIIPIMYITLAAPIKLLLASSIHRIEKIDSTVLTISSTVV